ncbi:hypothetical protein ACJX0J_033697, partial [Zea mays]
VELKSLSLDLCFPKDYAILSLHPNIGVRLKDFQCSTWAMNMVTQREGTTIRTAMTIILLIWFFMFNNLCIALTSLNLGPISGLLMIDIQIKTLTAHCHGTINLCILLQINAQSCFLLGWSNIKVTDFIYTEKWNVLDKCYMMQLDDSIVSFLGSLPVVLLHFS